MPGIIGLDSVKLDVNQLLQQAGQAVMGIRELITGKAIEDPNKIAEAAAKVTEALTIMNDAQNKVNAIEAASGSMFIAGPRPFLMWVCGFGFAWQFVIGPVCTWTTNLIMGKAVPLPVIDTTLMIQLLLALLGLAGMRTYEKLNNVEGNR